MFFKKRVDSPSPAKMGAKFSLPAMMIHYGEELFTAERDNIFEHYDWDISQLPARLEADEFNIEKQGENFIIDLEGNKLIYFRWKQGEFNFPEVDVKNWTSIVLITWLDRAVAEPFIYQSCMVDWLQRLVKFLIEERGIPLRNLMVSKYVLAAQIKKKFQKYFDESKGDAFQTLLFGNEQNVTLDWTRGFTFFDGIYGDDVYCPVTSYKFKKHFLSNVPEIDGGEEFECAKALDMIDEVEYWLRNVERHKNSFRFPAASMNFYPDFIAKLKDGRLLIVEYKGYDRYTNERSEEERTIAEFYARQSLCTDKQILFVMPSKSKNSHSIYDQIKAVVRKS